MNKLKTSSHNDAFYQNLAEIGPVVSPLGKGRVLRLNKFESPSPKDALWEAWLKLAQWFWRRFLKFLNVFFHYYVIISPWKRVGPFIYKNLNPFQPRILFAKEKKKRWKSLQRHSRRRTNCDQKSSLEPSAQVSW